MLFGGIKTRTHKNKAPRIVKSYNHSTTRCLADDPRAARSPLWQEPEPEVHLVSSPWPVSMSAVAMVMEDNTQSAFQSCVVQLRYRDLYKSG